MPLRRETERADSRRRRLAPALQAGQWRTIATMAGVVLGLHALGFFLLIAVVAPHHNRLGASGAFAVGTGLAAYTLGLRHAFDADHIAAIDGTTRKLMADGKRPVSVGFFFSLGHSTIVFGLAFALSLGAKALGRPGAGGSRLHDLAGSIGTGISGTFLLAIAALNVAVLWGIVRVFRQLRAGHCDERQLEAQLGTGGPMNRLFGRFAKTISTPWQMYPVGVLFGLGFDTASEVALLLLAAGAGGAGLPFYAVLCLPVLFAAGMSLLDTIDGALMNFAYGWAFSKPVRKVFYNMTVTGLSVVVAFVIGTIEVVGLLAEKLDGTGSFWLWWENVDVSTLGLIVAGVFLVTWAIALAVWRFARVEARWGVRLPSGETPRR
jgi:nickel/cobalt transporter (NiCoT) family protein